MASKIKNLSDHDSARVPNGEDYVVGIVIADYHTEITYELRNACIKALRNHGVKEENILIEYVPGAFELTYGAATLFMGSDCDGVIALGCVIKGDTDHDVYINHAVSHGLTELTLEYTAPFILGCSPSIR
jgi:6,7-dimethyl-8-ribityllumazine synthase